MRKQANYIIRFSGLNTGIHRFDFEVEKTFFEHFQNDEIKGCNIRVVVDLLKHSTMLELVFKIQGTLTVMCDTCIEDVNLPITNEEKLLVKFGEKENLRDEILTLTYGEHEIDIAPYIYEFAVLALPAKRIHAKGECNNEMIKKINEHTNKASLTQQGDPRWAALKNIKLN